MQSRTRKAFKSLQAPEEKSSTNELAATARCTVRILAAVSGEDFTFSIKERVWTVKTCQSWCSESRLASSSTPWIFSIVRVATVAARTSFNCSRAEPSRSNPGMLRSNSAGTGISSRIFAWISSRWGTIKSSADFQEQGVDLAVPPIGIPGSTVFPQQTFPYSLLPWIFLVYMLIGLMWLLIQRFRSPSLMGSMKGAVDRIELQFSEVEKGP